MFKAVIDTNVLISSIGLKSPNRMIFEKIKSGEILLVVSNEIIQEYKEIIAQKMTGSIAFNIIKYFQFSHNVLMTDIYFNWELITEDKSDNKFVDCYLASNADYLVTNDKHFNEIKTLDFPTINIINADEFMELLKVE